MLQVGRLKGRESSQSLTSAEPSDYVSRRREGLDKTPRTKSNFVSKTKRHVPEGQWMCACDNACLFWVVCVGVFQPPSSWVSFRPKRSGERRRIENTSSRYNVKTCRSPLLQQ